MTKYTKYFFLLFSVSLIAYLPLASLPASAQAAEAMSAMMSENDASSDKKNNEKESKGEGESSEDEATQVNFSDSIPVDEVLSSWENQYTEILEQIGLGDSVSARLAASAIILVFSVALYWLLSRLAHWVRQKIRKRNALLRLSASRVSFYYKALTGFALVVVVIATATALAATWGLNLEIVYTNEFYLAVLANAVTVFFIVMGGMLLVDAITGLVETAFHRWGSSRQSRVDTLLPIAKNTVYVTFFVIFTLMLLAELGINVVPLLAGAGVLGFAIGFGAQTFIKDLLTGFIIIFEDLIQVGDVVRLADKVGLVEKITIRKVQLRDLSGTVYTVPFSEISVVENLTKDFSYAMFDVGVAYREDIEYVCNLLEEIGDDLRSDEEFSGLIVEDLEILGLDKFADSAVVVKARMKTKPIEQWRVMREFNRRMKAVFDKHDIEIPFPHQTIYFGEDREGKAPPMRLKAEGDAIEELRSNAEPAERSRKGARGSNKRECDQKSRDTIPDNQEVVEEDGD